MNRNSKRCNQTLAIAGLILAGLLGGCELLVDFDRSRIPEPDTTSGQGSDDAGSSGGTMSNLDAGDASGPGDAGGDAGGKDAGNDSAMPASNRRPNAVDDSYATPLSWPLSVSEGTGLLVNDTDPDQDALSVVMVTKPSAGQLTLSGNGSFTYFDNGELTLAKGASQVVTFTYKASDGALLSDPTTVSITITHEPGDASIPMDAGNMNDGGLPDAN